MPRRSAPLALLLLAAPALLAFGPATGRTQEALPTPKGYLGGAPPLVTAPPPGARTPEPTAVPTEADREATPAAPPPAPPAVVPAAPFVAFGTSTVRSEQGMGLVLRRDVVPPGAALPLHVLPPHVHAGPYILVVEAGQHGTVVHRGQAVVGRGGAAAAPADGPPAPGEPVPLGTEIVLGPGDWIFVEGGAVVSERVVGDEALVVLTVAMEPLDQRPLIVTDEEGTPLVFTDEAGTPVPATPAA